MSQDSEGLWKLQSTYVFTSFPLLPSLTKTVQSTSVTKMWFRDVCAGRSPQPWEGTHFTWNTLVADLTTINTISVVYVQTDIQSIQILTVNGAICKDSAKDYINWGCNPQDCSNSDLLPVWNSASIRVHNHSGFPKNQKFPVVALNVLFCHSVFS